MRKIYYVLAVFLVATMMFNLYLSVDARVKRGEAQYIVGSCLINDVQYLLENKKCDKSINKKLRELTQLIQNNL